MTTEELEIEVAHLRDELDAILRILWDMRGLAKAQNERIEKEIEVYFKKYLERNKT